MARKINQLLEKIAAGEKPTEVDLSNEGLNEFPQELLALSDCLEVLNMGGNNLSSLPSEFTSFKKLRVLFFANNRFTEFPPLLGGMLSLFMVSFKSNRVEIVSPESLSPSISWLILTDNLIKELPPTIGNLKTLRKLMLAGNKLESLPDELSNCTELELLRIAANQLKSLPKWLFEMPNLSWFAYAGNPIEAELDKVSTPADNLIQIPYREIVVAECIGEGASGYVHKALWTKSGKSDDSDKRAAPLPVAVKLFKGETTSDGLPIHEMETTEAIGNHSHFIRVLGRLSEAPNSQLGLVLPLLDTSADAYQILGNPPSFDTITRDTFPAGASFTTAFVRSVLRGIASAGCHLHSAGERGRGIMHGDMYAHNILVHKLSHHALLTDLGAASFKTSTAHAIGAAFTEQECTRLEQIEVRAFGCLIDDLLVRMVKETSDTDAQYQIFSENLEAMRERCLCSTVSDRPTFSVLVEALLNL